MNAQPIRQGLAVLRGPVLRFALLIAVAGSLGCYSKSDRPSLGTVSGVVTFDGVPLDNACVVFKAEGKRMCRGFTNSAGKYELLYLRDIAGAPLGENRVYISILPEEEWGRVKFKLPDKYNRQTELTATVEPGSNTFDWELNSEQ